MPNPLLLQVLRRAVLPQHRDSRMPEGVKPSPAKAGVQKQNGYRSAEACSTQNRLADRLFPQQL